MLKLGKIEKILVPCDFSPASKKALAYGLSMALEAQAALVLVHILPFSSMLAYAYPLEGDRVTRDKLDEIGGRLADLVGEEHRKSVDLRVVSKAGNVHDELLGLIDDERPDLVVMGTHGRRRFQRWVLGSVTEFVLRRTTAPLLTVSRLDSEHELDRSEPVTLDRLLYATDLSASDRDATETALAIAADLSSDLMILHVMHNLGWGHGSEFIPFDVEARTVRARDTAFKRLLDSVPEAARSDPRIRIELREGIPYETILEVADTEKVDMILLNTRSRSGLDRALLGSTAERVVRGAHVPVLCLPVA
jgi:nucleotide-binding universal stress UspA family protein